MADRTISSPLSLRHCAPWVVTAAALISGLPTLFNDFAWDDTYIVGDNPVIRDLANIPTMFTQTWASGVGYALGDIQNRGYYRPFALLTMAVDWAVGGGGNPIVFHATNVVLHALATLFLSLWLCRVWGVDSRLSTIVALAWAVHPVHTEAVALVAYRTTLLMGLFTFAGLWALASPDGRLPSWPRVVGGLSSFTLGLFSRETMLIFPALLLLSDLAGPPWTPALKRGETGGRLVSSRLAQVYLPMGLVATGWWVLRSRVISGGVYDWFEGLETWQKALMVPRVFFLYVRLSVLPYPLCPFYDWDILGVPVHAFEPDILAGFLLLTGFVGGALFLRTRMPDVAFGLAFFLLALLPFSHIVPFFDAAGERFLYVPLVGMLIAVVGLCCKALATFCALRPRLALARPILLVVVVGAFSTLTIVRHTEWRNSETALRAMRRDFPHSVSANLGLGRLLLAEDRFHEALEPLGDVVRLSPRLSVGYGLLAAAQALSGDVPAARDTLMRAPLPEPRLPSAAQVARAEMLRRGAVNTLRRVGL